MTGSCAHLPLSERQTCKRSEVLYRTPVSREPGSGNPRNAEVEPKFFVAPLRSASVGGEGVRKSEEQFRCSRTASSDAEMLRGGRVRTAAAMILRRGTF